MIRRNPSGVLLIVSGRGQNILWWKIQTFDKFLNIFRNIYVKWIYREKKYPAHFSYFHRMILFIFPQLDTFHVFNTWYFSYFHIRILFIFPPHDTIHISTAGYSSYFHHIFIFHISTTWYYSYFHHRILFIFQPQDTFHYFHHRILFIFPPQDTFHISTT